MARPISEAFAQALRDGKPLALLAIIDHPNGLQYLWTGVGSLSYNAKTYIGIGRMGSIAQIEFTNDLVIQDVALTLSGVDATNLSFLNAAVRNRTADAWLAAIDAGRVVADPYQFLDAELDYQTLSVAEDGTANVILTARTGFFALDRALNEVWSVTDQRRQFPTDAGLDLLHMLLIQEVRWRRSA